MAQANPRDTNRAEDPDERNPDHNEALCSITRRLDTKNNISFHMMDELRRIRDRLLRESDWALMEDSQVSDYSKMKWKHYRQDLRDFMARENPTIDTLPQPPEYIKKKPPPKPKGFLQF